MNSFDDGSVFSAIPASPALSGERSGRSSPPGRIKIMAALTSLLGDKEFVSITIADIARTAGVTEALIYKYFDDKRDLLHQVLAEYLAHFVTKFERELSTADDPLEKLRKVVLHHMSMYAHDRIFARILLVEVRNYSDYFNSPAYSTVKHYAEMVLEIIKQGMAEGSIRRDVPAEAIRGVILGGIEHACLGRIIFGRDFEPDTEARQICQIIFQGIVTTPNNVA